MTTRKTYIGDSVYCDFDGYALILTIENDGESSNTIYLEPSVWDDLVAYVERLKKPAAEEPVIQGE
jgi:hypothetical protein